MRVNALPGSRECASRWRNPGTNPASAPDFATGSRIRAIRWLHPGYKPRSIAHHEKMGSARFSVDLPILSQRGAGCGPLVVSPARGAQEERSSPLLSRHRGDAIQAPSFRGDADGSAQGAARWDRTRNLEIQGSRYRAPRNDGFL
jgi:hypothetical protein